MKDKKEKETNNNNEEKTIEDILNQLKEKDKLLNVPKTLLKKEEWGLLTILSLLLAGVFPAYFVNILLISFFTEVGHLYTTHLSETERKKLIDFEKEFRKGYKKEQEKRWEEAIDIYKTLCDKYKENPKISNIAVKRIEWIEKKYLNKG